MSQFDRQLKWLRRGLATFVGLLALTVTCGLIWALLSSLGDTVGARAFRIVTLGVTVTAGMSGIALLIGAVWSLVRIQEASRT